MVFALKLDFHIYTVHCCPMTCQVTATVGCFLGHCKIQIGHKHQLYMKGALLVMMDFFFFFSFYCFISEWQKKTITRLNEWKCIRWNYCPCQDNLTVPFPVLKGRSPCPRCFLIKNKIHVLFVISWVFFFHHCIPVFCSTPGGFL